ncbi:MAG: NUDIX hydrolase [bacterium]
MFRKMFYYIGRNLVLKVLFKFLNIVGVGIPPIPTVSAIIPVGCGKILMIKLSYANGWALPGGGLKQGETFIEGVKREVFEETGLVFSEAFYLGTYTAVRREYSTVHVCFEVPKTSGKIKSSLEGEVLKVSVQEAIRRCVYEDEKRALLEYIARVG